MRSTSDQVIAVVAAVATIVAISVVLYRPRVQRSESYQATVVPLANIMDVGFILFAPAIVLLTGAWGPLVMSGICLVAFLAGCVIAYNIRHYETLDQDRAVPDRVELVSQLSLLAASVVNIAYYTLLLAALVLLPLEANSEGRRSVFGAVLLLAVMVIGLGGGMAWLNRQGDRTTAFNLAAVTGVVVAFLVFNAQEWLGGRWTLGDTPQLTDDGLRQIIGLFAIVQGFEASRYIGVRFGAATRISTMRAAQVISTVVFVVFVASVLVMFPSGSADPDGTAIFLVSELVDSSLPWLLFVAAIGSQTAAIIGATSSRSDMLVGHGVSRRLTFPVVLVPATLLVVFVDVNMAVNLASRVFAGYFALQSCLAVVLAARRRQYAAAAGFVGIGSMMLAILVFGLPL